MRAGGRRPSEQCLNSINNAATNTLQLYMVMTWIDATTTSHNVIFRKLRSTPEEAGRDRGEVRTGLQDASIAGLLVTTERIVAEQTKKKAAPIRLMPEWATLWICGQRASVVRDRMSAER